MRARFQYYSTTFSGANYDNAYRTKSGSDVWLNCMHFPVKATQPQFLQQGLVNIGDHKLYVHGSVYFDENVKIGLGSPVNAGSVFVVGTGGIEEWPAFGGVVYRKAYIKVLNNGSFLNEY